MILTSDRRKLAQHATSSALRLRRDAGYSLQDAICVYDLAEKLGIEVRFFDVASMEGMYSNSPKPHVIISSLRPSGRQAFTCAHEVAHHRFGHGIHIDEIADSRSRGPKRDPQEFVADCFAGILLMPKLAVENAFRSRGWHPSNCTPAQIYALSSWFGVGYTTIINHMRWGLGIMSDEKRNELLRISVKQIKKSFLGREVSENLAIVDNNWISRPIDLCTDDFMLASRETRLEGSSVEYVSDISGTKLFRAIRPGISRIEEGSGWSSFVRVSRKEYIGRSIYRHMENVDDE